MNRFLGDPAVYPTLDSLFQDINFKSFLEIDPTTAYTKDNIEVKAFTSLKRSDKELFIFDDLTLEHKSSKLPLFFKTFHKKMASQKIDMLSLMEEFSKKQILALNLHQVKIDDSYFKKKEPPQKKAPHPIDVMNKKLDLIQNLRMPQKLRNLNPMPVLPKLPK